jgi:hypothetical protein
MSVPIRSQQQRQRDVLDRLAHDVDVWVATADPTTGAPYLIPLSFLWDGSTILLATPAASVTGQNMQATGQVRLGLGTTRDVVLIEGTVEAQALDGLPADIADAFAAKTGFDPRRSKNAFLYFRVRPVRVQAWYEEPELAGRTLMRDGRWLVSGGSL